MQISVSSTLIVYHDGQFWVGIVERVEDGSLVTARIVFGADPSNEELLCFIIGKWEKLVFRCSVKAEEPKLARNPKRRQREAAKELSKHSVSTKSQLVLAKAREASKAEGKARRVQAKRETQELRFVRKQEKKRQKHKGR